MPVLLIHTVPFISIAMELHPVGLTCHVDIQCVITPLRPAVVTDEEDGIMSGDMILTITTHAVPQDFSLLIKLCIGFRKDDTKVIIRPLKLPLQHTYIGVLISVKII